MDKNDLLDLEYFRENMKHWEDLVTKWIKKNKEREKFYYFKMKLNEIVLDLDLEIMNLRRELNESNK